MRDGVRLSTDLYFPAPGDEPRPVIFIRTPYDKGRDSWYREDTDRFLERGYVVALQDVRGRYQSEGTWVYGKHERDDGYDTLTWLAAQSWCSGKIGTYGCSYHGQVQVQLAAEKHPNHTAAIAQATSGLAELAGKPHRSNYEHGVLDLANSFSWLLEMVGNQHYPRLPADLDRETYLALAERFVVTDNQPSIDYSRAFRHLPLIDAMKIAAGPAYHPLWESYIAHPPADPFWKEFGYLTGADTFDIPTLHVNSWYDFGVRDTLEVFRLFQANAVSYEIS
jgi:hypothetical protein